MADQLHRTSTEVSVLVPEIWSRRFYDVLLADLPFESLISRDWEGEIQNLGDTVRISTVPEFDEATVLPEDARSDADAVTVTQQSLIINQRVVKDFIVTNKAQLQSIPFVDELRDKAIFAINKKIQSLIISLIVPSVTPDHSIAYDSSTTLAFADLLEVKELLDDQDVPKTDRHMVLGSAQMNDLFNITNFTSSDFLLTGAPSQTGDIPSALLGFNPNMTTVVGNTAYFFHRSFMTIATQQGMDVRQFDLGVDGKRAQRINLDVLLGILQLDDKRVVTLS